jgi:hypothetical protein
MLPELFQAENMRDAAWGCDWVGTPVPFQRCLLFIIATANKQFTLTAGKFVPVSNKTMLNVSSQCYILCERDAAENINMANINIRCPCY